MPATRSSTRQHHGALDGGILGGLTGKLGNKGHTKRDAAIGAGAGHAAERHHEKNLFGKKTHTAKPTMATTGAAPGQRGTFGDKRVHHGMPVGTPGTVTTTTTVTVPKPSAGDKLSGGLDVMMGKMTHNPRKVQIGQIKKNQGKAGLVNAGLAHPV